MRANQAKKYRSQRASRRIYKVKKELVQGRRVCSTIIRDGGDDYD